MFQLNHRTAERYNNLSLDDLLRLLRTTWGKEIISKAENECPRVEQNLNRARRRDRLSISLIK